VFYDTEEQARRDGFRPCKRCKPDVTTFVGEGEEIVTRTIALLRVKKDDSTMKSGLKELATEVGVTPSYLCRVFKKTIGLTVGAYVKEFEREASESEAESSVQSPSEVGSEVVDVEMGLLTPATTARSLSVPVEGRKGGPVEGDVGNVEEALDLDFDFDEWFWTEDFSKDSIYG
jgi:AraC-like DNA-binding protein